MYIYRFWHMFKNPSALTFILEKEDEIHSIQGYKKAVIILLLTTILLFALRDFYGMYTSRLTSLLGQGLLDTYLFARILSLTGAILFAIVFYIFHYYVVTYLISLLTDLPFKWVTKIQLYVIAVIILFKFIEFIIFANVQFVPLYSPFSVAAIISQFTSNLWVLFFINQIKVATIITIYIQFKFLSKWVDEGKILLFLKLIVVQLLLAAAIATFSVTPLMEWLGRGLN